MHVLVLSSSDSSSIPFQIIMFVFIHPYFSTVFPMVEEIHFENVDGVYDCSMSPETEKQSACSNWIWDLFFNKFTQLQKVYRNNELVFDRAQDYKSDPLQEACPESFRERFYRAGQGPF